MCKKLRLRDRRTIRQPRSSRGDIGRRELSLQIMLRDEIGQEPPVAHARLSDEIARREHERQRFANRVRGRLNSGEDLPRQFQTLPPRS
jgi:hypothetical protein